MTRLYSFPPIAAADARILLLGSMPGEASLRAQQYYAHPRNAFWPIMGDLCRFDPRADYDQRVAALKRCRIAVWDVLKACIREGSLDTAIESAGMELNDFHRFLVDHAGIQKICFNGGKAEDLYLRRVRPKLPDLFRSIDTLRLPSTSPAHASRTFDEKLATWRAAIG